MRRICKIIICCIVMMILAGCSVKQINTEETNSFKETSSTEDFYNNDIIKITVQKTIEALDSKNINNIEDLFYAPAIQDMGFHNLDSSEINRFLSTYSGSKRVIFNDGSCIIGDYRLDGVQYKTYASVVAIVETEDNLYYLNFFFCDSLKDENNFLIALQIITAKSEAYGNACLDCEYITDNRESFSYIDYNDSAFDNIASEYRVIMSEILCYDENAAMVTEAEADQFIENDITTKEQIINQFGEPAAVYTDVGDIAYYPMDIDRKYLKITYYIGKEVVRRYDIVGEWYPKWMELQ